MTSRRSHSWPPSFASDRRREARLVGRQRGWAYVRGAHKVSARAGTRHDSQQLENGGRIFGCLRARARRSGKGCPGRASFYGRCHRSDIPSRRRPSPRYRGGRQRRRLRCSCGSKHEGSRRLDRYRPPAGPTHQRRQLPCSLLSAQQRRSRYKPRVETMLPPPITVILTIEQFGAWSGAEGVQTARLSDGGGDASDIRV